MDQPLELDNPLWRFSLAVYAAPDVQRECLALQNGPGVNVNMLLYCAWRGMEGDSLTASTLQRLNEAVHAWRAGVVLPLRRIRNDLKTMPLPDFSGDSVKALRSDVLAVELRAEQIEQAMLFRETASDFERGEDRSAAIAANLALYLAGYGKKPDDARAVQSSAERLSRKQM
jgi:uncharacterized protein (TIGR02444 family)